VRAHNQLKTFLFFGILVFLSSCSKEGTDFIDDTANFPLNWKMDDSQVIFGYNAIDSVRSIRNTSVMPFGTKVDAHYGTLDLVFTLAIKRHYLARVSWMQLSRLYYTNHTILCNSTPVYGAANQPFSVEVYEMTEGIETDPNSKKMSYAYTLCPARL
jgi:hypothetical protein